MRPPALLTIRAQVPALKAQEYRRIVSEYAEAQIADGSLLGWSLWGNLERPEILLAVLEVAEEGWEHFGSGDREVDDMLVALEGVAQHPESVRSIRIRRAGGRNPRDMAPDTFLSISDRTAEPGRADELAEDYDHVFGSFEVLPGFAGYLYGPYGGLEEKLYGFALWETEDALRESIAKPMRHELRIYRRLGDRELRTIPSAFRVEGADNAGPAANV